MNRLSDFNDLMLVDEEGRLEFFVVENTDFFDLDPQNMIGSKATQWYKNLDEMDSTLMRAVLLGEERLDYQQILVTKTGKSVRQVSDTLCLKNGDKVVGAVELARYDYIKDVVASGEEVSTQKTRKNSYELIGCSPLIEDIRSKLDRIKNIEAPILITGESGTGKENLARVIHKESNRSDAPFVYVNCGAMPVNLMESLLFGTSKGSFTGSEERPGLFHAAEGGILFLDELNEMPLSIQSKLLKAIEDKKIRKVGAAEEKFVDVRIIASCSEEMDSLIKGDSLRKDLFFRLSTVQFQMKPLRQRTEDIRPLSEHFLSKFEEDFGKKVKGFDERVFDIFEHHIWSGNVRELRNIIEGAYHVCSGRTIGPEDISRRIAGSREKKADDDRLWEEFMASGKDINAFLKSRESEIISRALADNKGKLSATAKALGMRSDTLLKKLRRDG